MRMKLKIGTRASALALTQTNSVIHALGGHIVPEIIEIKTSGDKKQGTEAARTGDKKDWVYELELALLEGTIDLAVHSGKDIPGNIEPGTKILPVLQRATPNDIFIGKIHNGERIRFEELPSGAKVGTSSLRRKAALQTLNRGIIPVDHRGNVPTRIKKLDESSELSGIILAAAGVERLRTLSPDQYELLALTEMIPAMNQGILAVQFRDGDYNVENIVSLISSPELQAVFFAERACAETLQGDCNSAISIFAEISDGLTVTALVYAQDGSRSYYASHRGDVKDFHVLGTSVAEAIIRDGYCFPLPAKR